MKCHVVWIMVMAQRNILIQKIRVVSGNNLCFKILNMFRNTSTSTGVRNILSILKQKLFNFNSSIIYSWSTNSIISWLELILSISKQKLFDFVQPPSDIYLYNKLIRTRAYLKWIIKFNITDWDILWMGYMHISGFIFCYWGFHQMLLFYSFQDLIVR